MKRKLVLIALIVCLALLAIGGVWLTGTLLTQPAPQLIGNLPPDLVGREVQFRSESGSTIHGWFIPGQKGVGAVLLMHGVRANRLAMLDRARFLSRAGYAVLLFDLQAHGESPGTHITFGYLESKDAQAAVRFLRAQAPGEKVGVIGVSLGGAAAALAQPPLEVNALVLEMVYPTIDQAIADRLKLRLGSWAGGLAPLLSWQLKPLLGIGANELRPIDHVASLRMPTLFIAGAEDRHTTLAESQQLFDAASEPKQFWIVAGAAHIDLHQFAKAEYERRLIQFFSEHLRQD